MESNHQEITMWEEEIESLRRKVNTTQVKDHLNAFYGSSSIRLWESMMEDLEPHPVINLGFGGSSYYWCNYYFERVFDGLQPKKIILYAGDNDLGTETPMPEIETNLQSLLNKIENHSPGTNIAIISVKPSPDRAYLRDSIEELNKKIKLIVEEKGGDFIDLYSKMLSSDGSYRPALFTEDMLHMNELGYDIWKSQLMTYLSNSRS